MFDESGEANFGEHLPELKRRLRAIVGDDAVIDDAQSLRAYETDALTAYRQAPPLVVLPGSTREVSEALRLCNEMEIKVVPRGAGTSLSGGALPLADGIVLGLSRFNQIREIDYPNRCVTAQCGVTNLALSDAVREAGFYYAPDPSSQIACTIGGNVAENSGGVHCLKYGLTSHNVLGLEAVLMNGDILSIGGKYTDQVGYDLTGILGGSEGLLAVVTEVTVRILRTPESARAVLAGFASLSDAGRCVASVVAAGVIPAGMEMMDKLATSAAEAFVNAGYPLDCEAVLIIEVDGSTVEVEEQVELVEEIARDHGASSLRASQNEMERLQYWAGRKAAFPAVGRLAPDYYCMDGTIPRQRIAEVLERIASMSEEFKLSVANVFHAGDGNLHPLILYDANIPGELERAEEFGNEILRLCVSVGGVLSGEHGIGVEKRGLMPEVFSDEDLRQQQRVKCAFDPLQRLNPGKVFPTLHRCAELGRMHVHQGQLPHADLPRF